MHLLNVFLFSVGLASEWVKDADGKWVRSLTEEPILADEWDLLKPLGVNPPLEPDAFRYKR